MTMRGALWWFGTRRAELLCRFGGVAGASQRVGHWGFFSHYGLGISHLALSSVIHHPVVTAPQPPEPLGRSRRVTEGYGGSRRVTEGHGGLRRVAEGRGGLRRVTEGY